MKKLFFIEIFLVVIFLIGCQSGSEEETYTVWAYITTADDFQQTFGITLYDGKYIPVEFSNAQFSQMAQTLKNEGAEFKHN